MTACRMHWLHRTVLALPLLAQFGCASQAPLPVPTAANPCPQWTYFPADRHSNRDSPYLGCSNAVDLRAMLANPADLDHGRTLGPADGEREGRAVSDWQQGKVKPDAGTGAMAPSITMPSTDSAQ